MTSFLEGPANGQTLMLRRAPRFLRVVESAGKFDALDQPHDEATETESIHVYEIAEFRGMVHISCSPRTNSGTYAHAVYRHVTPQPQEDEVRASADWHAWCQAAADSELQPAAQQ